MDIVRGVDVGVPIDRAFDVFTKDIGLWWPSNYSIGARGMANVVLEPWPNGRWFEVDGEGSECLWGEVLLWEPPARVVLAWRIGSDWKYDETLLTTVDVSFEALGEANTRVTLRHAHLERVGRGMAATFEGSGGWGHVLSRYLARTRGAPEPDSGKKRVLVYCGNGFQGRAIARALIEEGHSVNTLVRQAQHAADLTQMGVTAITAAFEEKKAFNDAHQGIDAVVMQFPAVMPPEMTRQFGQAAILAARRAGIKKVIFNTAVQYPAATKYLPSFQAKQDVETEVLRTFPDATVIRPSFLLSNLLLPWAASGIKQAGELAYPIPADVALSWTAPGDIGRLAAMSLGAGLDLALAGADRPVVGDELAEAFSNGLRRRIRYRAMPIDEFERGVDDALGPGAGAEVGAIFRFIADNPADRGFVSTPLSLRGSAVQFQPTHVEQWVTLHASHFS